MDLLEPFPSAAQPSNASRSATARDAVRTLLETALTRAVARGSLPALSEGDPFAIEISRPANPEHGDLATNLALKLARPLRRPPPAIAAAIVAELSDENGSPAGPIRRAEVAGPGFVNLWLAAPFLEGALDAARQAGPDYGRAASRRPERINVEFVSANPTGPLTVGNARGAFVGDLLCRLLEHAGHPVTREYLFNDSGTQVTNLGASILAARRGEPIPEDGYHGDYVLELARDVPETVWDAATASAAQRGAATDDDQRAAGPDSASAEEVLGRWASEQIRSGIEESLARLGVHFDVWRTEGSLLEEGWLDRGVAHLRDGGHLYETDGATWFRSTAFGDDKDRVVIRSNGRPTYFAYDVGYLAEKFSRGFDRLIYIWGSDHHGTVARLRNAAAAMGFDPEAVEVLLTAWVRFVHGGEEISMSKRSGAFISLDELLAEVGADAARWYFASRAPSTGVDFDIELARKQTNENPVYYVQYAHARIASILRRAADVGLPPAVSLGGSLEGDAAAATLAKTVIRFPEVVEDAAPARETQGITAYATDLATTFHAYYRDRRVVEPADPATSAARLALVDATRIALANALGLLGISAPDAM